jgi:hypothetical protein
MSREEGPREQLEEPTTGSERDLIDTVVSSVRYTFRSLKAINYSAEINIQLSLVAVQRRKTAITQCNI